MRYNESAFTSLAYLACCRLAAVEPSAERMTPCCWATHLLRAVSQGSHPLRSDERNHLPCCITNRTIKRTWVNGHNLLRLFLPAFKNELGGFSRANWETISRTDPTQSERMVCAYDTLQHVVRYSRVDKLRAKRKSTYWFPLMFERFVPTSVVALPKQPPRNRQNADHANNPTTILHSTQTPFLEACQSTERQKSD